MGRPKKNQEESSSIIKSIPKPQLNLATETKKGIAVIVFLILAGITCLSILGSAGGLGQFIFKIFTLLFGVIAYTLPLLFLLIAYLLFKSEQNESGSHPYFRTYFGIFLSAGSVAGLIHLFNIDQNMGAVALANAGRAGGWLGAMFGGPVMASFGLWAGCLLLIGVLVIGVVVTLNLSPVFWLKRKDENEKINQKISSKPEKIKINTPIENTNLDVGVEDVETEEDMVEAEEQKIAKKPINIVTAPLDTKDNEALQIDSIVLEDRKDWKLPPFDLLDDNKTEVDSGNIENNVQIIQKTLADFGIEVEMGEVNVGPTVTQYTLRPSTGVKLSQIAGLQNDLALALAAHAIRMELPIPGKPLVGIEVPNKSTAIVRLREVMQTTDFINHKSKLALALGRDVAGRPMIADLAKMPHMMIAGATGTGKSVAINSLFVSLLYRNTPQDIKFIVVDPKRVELSVYNGIPHLLTPAITEPDKAVNALKWAVSEMERRYKLLAEAGNRNITDYNAKTELKLPYIVIIVDELADLMAVAQADVEATIVRLAQMARAVGIHLILATQRPSVEVITGLIKANITSRIAFAVASQIDSRTIIDASGAEKLLGNGDMLFTSAESNRPRRIQGAYVGETEVHKVVDFFKAQAGAVIYNEEVVEKPKRSLGIPGMDDGGGVDDDELLDAAKEEVMRAGKASSTLLQRRLRVGYSRAARLIDILEKQGVIGPADGSKPREVYGVSDAEKSEYGSAEDEDSF